MRRRAARQLVEWARERAVRVDPLDASADVELLAPLDPLLEGKRLVFLGEANHWVHEKYAYRVLFLRYLHSRGFRWLAEELAWSDGVRVDAYLKTGDESWLDRVTAYGYRGHRREDRDDSATGILGDMFEHYPQVEFNAEQRRFAAALRELNVSCAPDERLRFFGFDIDYEPGVGYEVLEELTASGAEPLPAPLVELLARVPGESLAAEVERLGRSLAYLDAEADALGARLGGMRLRELRHTVRTLEQSHEYIRLAHPAPTWEELRPAMAVRERLMVEHLAHILEQAGRGRKGVLMSHNAHLARNDAGIRMPAGTVGPGGDGAQSIGSWLHERLPGQIATVWMLEGGGADSRPMRASRRLSSPRGSLNRLLGDVGDAFALPTHSDDPRAALLGRELEVMSIYGQTHHAAVADQADALFFVREVTPLRA